MSDSRTFDPSVSALTALWNCSPSIVNDLQRFALDIWRIDILSVDAPDELVLQARIDAQRSKLSLPDGLLKAPLPIVAACQPTTDSYQRMPQLLVTRGDDGHRLWRTLQQVNRGGPQESSKVVFGAAVSGVGKTHAAYDVGRNFACTIIIRVVDSDEPRLAPPFWWLIYQLRPFLDILDKNPSYHEEISDTVASYIHLVLLAYVFVTVMALCLIHESDLPRKRDLTLLREFVLRLHRNREGDSLVRRLLEESITNGIVKKSSLPSQLHGPDMGKVKEIEAACSATLQRFGRHLILAVDEAHELMNYNAARECGRLVLRDRLAPINRAGPSASPVGGVPSQAISLHDQIANIRAAGGTSPDLGADSATGECDLAALEISTSAPDAFLSMPTVAASLNDPDPGGQRSLFYSLMIVLSRLGIQQRWYPYITGTSFTMKYVLNAASMSLKMRTEAQGCAPIHLFRVNDMEFILNHYFNLPNDFIDDPTRDLLRQFEGRPVLFVEGVWHPLLDEVTSTSTLPSAEWWRARLAATKSRLVDRWKRHTLLNGTKPST